MPTHAAIPAKAFDVVIAGGGSAGAVPARLFSENPNRAVLLLEAGPAYAPDAYPDVIADANRVGGNVYALKREARSMDPVAGAIIWTRSSEATPDELDLHISGTHIVDPAESPTGDAIVLACSVTLPKSVGSVRLASRDPRAMPLIRYNFFEDPSDLRRMMEAVRLSRRIGRTAPFSAVVEAEMFPGLDVRDDEALQRAVVSAVDGYAHPTSSVPMGGPDDPRAVVAGSGGVRGVEALNVVDASIMPDIVSAPTKVTTVMLAEAISRRLD